MARDTEKNQYFNVGVPRDSFLLQMLRQDAAASGIPVAQLLALRAADWYKGMHLISATGALTPSSPPAQTAVEASVVPSEPDEGQLQDNINALLEVDFFA